MFIPTSIDSCIFSYNNNVFQFFYDEDNNTITFESFDGTSTENISLELLKRLTELSEQ